MYLVYVSMSLIEILFKYLEPTAIHNTFMINVYPYIVEY